MNKIAIIGDPHCNLDAVIEVANEPDLEAIVSVGDLAIFKTLAGANVDKKALKHTETPIKYYINAFKEGTFPKLKIPLYIVKGNHDDYDYMYDSCFTDHNIFYTQQGKILNFGNLKIATLGGIKSPVRISKDPATLKGRERRFFTQSEINSLIGKTCDILITHQAAEGVLPKETSEGKHIHREEGCKELKELLDNLNPFYYIHGHHHRNYESTYKTTQVIGLGNFGKNQTSKVYFDINHKYRI